jgi:hypothetical protein
MGARKNVISLFTGEKIRIANVMPFIIGENQGKVDQLQESNSEVVRKPVLKEVAREIC